MNKTVADAFLADILSRPDDDAPRLIYADWLEETGTDPARAEFIRVQCALPKVGQEVLPSGNVVQRTGCAEDDAITRRLMNRQKEILRAPAHGRALANGVCWLGTLQYIQGIKTGWYQGKCYHRGFVECIETDGNTFVRYAATILHEHPIQQVRLSFFPETSRPVPNGDIHLLHCPEIHTLAIPGEPYFEVPMRLLRLGWPHIQFAIGGRHF